MNLVKIKKIAALLMMLSVLSVAIFANAPEVEIQQDPPKNNPPKIVVPPKNDRPPPSSNKGGSPPKNDTRPKKP